MSDSDNKDILSSKAVRWTMFTFGFALNLIGVVSTVIVNVGSGTVIIVTGLAFILLAVFEVQSLELLGLSAKLKVRLNEAEVLLEKIRKVSVPLTQLAVSVAIRSGRWDSYIPSIKVYEPLKEIEKQLVERGLTTLDDFADIKGEVINNLAFELNELIVNKIKFELEREHQVLDSVTTALNEISAQQNASKVQELMMEMNAVIKEINKVTALTQSDIPLMNEKIKEYLNGENRLPVDRKKDLLNEVIDIGTDINVLFDTGELRRPDILKEVR